MPVSGYYEWHDTPEGKQPYYFTRADGEVMTIAAIQDAWTPPDGEKLWSCAMVIAEPNKFVAEVHDPNFGTASKQCLRQPDGSNGGAEMLCWSEPSVFDPRRTLHLCVVVVVSVQKRWVLPRLWKSTTAR